MAAFDNLDPITLQNILATMPEIRRRQSKADKLRAARESFQQMQQTPAGSNYEPTQQGGRFRTIAAYQNKMAPGIQQAIGAIGGLMTDKMQTRADEDLNTMRDEQILRTANQIGQDVEGGATDNAMRAYLGMIGGPDVTKTMAKAPHTSGRFEDAEGNIWILGSDMEYHPTGLKAPAKGQVLEIPGQVPQMVDTSGANRGKARDIQFGGGVATPPFNPNAVPGQAPQGGGFQQLPVEELLRRVQGAETGGEADPNTAVSTAGARGPMQLMPETARELEKAMGLPPGSTDTDPAANIKAGQKYFMDQLQAFGGDQEAAAIAYNAGPENAKKWLAAGRDYGVLPKREETEPYVKRILGGGQAPSAPQAPSQSSFRIPTKAEEAGSAETAKINAQNALAPQTAAAEALKTQAGERVKIDEKTAGEARAKLPDMELSLEELDLNADNLINNPGLDQIVGGTIGGRLVSDDGLGSEASNYMFNAVMAGTPAVEALAQHRKLRGQVMESAYQKIRGAGQITEFETKFASEALADIKRSKTKEAYIKGVRDFQRAYRSAVNRVRMVGNGQYAAPGTFIEGSSSGTPMIPQAAAPAAAPDPRAALRSKYGL